MADSLGDPAPTFFVDDERIRGVPGPEMTAAQILAAAGHDADAVDLYAAGSHGERLAPEQRVAVQDGARFVTQPRAHVRRTPERTHD